MARVSRSFRLLGYSIVQNSRSFAQIPLLNFSKPCLLHSLRLNRRICSAVTLDSDSSALSTSDPDLPKPASVANQTKKFPKTFHMLDNRGSQNQDMKPGDWLCTECRFMNFARNLHCLNCKAKGPERIYTVGRAPEMKMGDWNCPQCSFMNFSRNRQCLRCQSSPSERNLRPGDWDCPECDFVNFSRNTSCKKCNRERSKGSAMEQGLHTWKKPY